MEKIRLIIICEDNASKKGLKTIFNIEETFDVLCCLSLPEALESCIKLQPDVILLDISIQELAKCGQEVSQIKHECPYSITIALVENEQCDCMTELLEIGIDCCVPKNVMRSCLIKIIELTCQTGVICMPKSFRKMVSCSNAPVVRPSNNVNLIGFSGNKNGAVEALTKREKEILQLMAENYSNREIADLLFISEPTVKTHVSNILRKLGQSNRAQAVVYSYKMGLVSDMQFAHK